ncbi:MAG: CBS domain-containing protein, partial [Deltaproteobacteria bacterium]
SHMIQRVEKMLGTTVGDCMTSNPVTVAPDTSASEVANIMAKQKMHTIPVVEGDKLLGVIGKLDMVRAMAEGYEK